MSKQLTAGFNHVALVTADLDRLIAFYHEVFEAPVVVDLDEGHVRHAFIDMGGGSWIHAFMMPNNTHGIGSPEISHGDTLTTLSSTSSTKTPSRC